jgi:SAM-dependent methyltransferase
MSDPTRRFSNRVENYVKNRPGYPRQLYAYLRAEAGLPAGGAVADIGSGTGLSSQLFLAEGHPVFAVEPNAEMRAAAEAGLAGQPGFTSLAGRAEQIPLADACVDLAVAAQAFHWFEGDAARREAARILRPGSQAALIWNQRDVTHSPFQQGYEELLMEFGTDFKDVDHQRKVSDEQLAAFFAPHAVRQAWFLNSQRFDFEALQGRLLSSSYVPLPGQPAYAPMLAALRSLFEQHQNQGAVDFVYRTVVFHAPLTQHV